MGLQWKNHAHIWQARRGVVCSLMDNTLFVIIISKCTPRQRVPWMQRRAMDRWRSLDKWKGFLKLERLRLPSLCKLHWPRRSGSQTCRLAAKRHHENFLADRRDQYGESCRNLTSAPCRPTNSPFPHPTHNQKLNRGRVQGTPWLYLCRRPWKKPTGSKHSPSDRDESIGTDLRN